MASFFKNLFRKEGDSQPIPAAPLTQEPDQGRMTGLGGVPESIAVPRSGLPQGPGGPFSAVSGRHMTARELAALLPPSLLRFDGVNPDHPVALPLDALRQSMAAGRPVLWLSQIHDACPGLFQRPLQNGEDMEITLPLARVKGILEGTGPIPQRTGGVPIANPTPSAVSGPVNPFAAIPPQRAVAGSPAAMPQAPSPVGNPFAQIPPPAAGGTSPFAPASSHPAPPSAAPAASPFATVPPAAGGAFLPSHAPTAGSGPLPASQPHANGSPFAVSPSAPATGNPFAPVTSAAAPANPPPFPVAAAHSNSSTGHALPLPAAASLPSSATPPAASPFSVAATPAAAARTTGPIASPFSVASSPVGKAPPVLPVASSPVVPPQSAVPSAPLQPCPFAPIAASSAASPPALPSLQPPAVPAPAAPLAVNGFPISAVSAGQGPAPLAWPPAAAPQASPIPPLPRNTIPVSAPAAQSSPLAPISAKAGPPPLVASNLPPVSTSSPFMTVNAPGQAASAPVASAIPTSSLLSAQVAAPAPPPHSTPVVPPLASVVPVSNPVLPIAATPTPAAASTSSPVPMLEGDSVNLSLRAVLRDADPAQLGFAPDNVPESVRVVFPLALISRQLASGRVQVSVEEICTGITEKFRPAFARAMEGLQITIPMSEVFHNLPESAKPSLEPAAPEAHLSITTSPFQTPFAIKAEEDSKQLLDLSATGFAPSNRLQRPTTQPVPAVELPPAPLPLVLPVLPAQGGAPPVQVELPILRPVASTTPPSADSVGLPRPGPLSRPPGSGTAPTPPRSAPRIKSVPASPTALKAFPKPASAPPVGDSAPNGLPPLLTPPGSGKPGLPPSPTRPVLPSAAPATPAPPPLAVGLPPLVPMLPPVAALTPAAPVIPSFRDNGDDLGESFSAAALSAEPPPRAGSAPVKLPVTPASTPVPPLVTPPLLAEITAPAHAAELNGFPSSPANPADLASAPSWPPVSAAAESPTSLPALTTPASAAEDLTFGVVSDIRQLTLRAVLGTDQSLTPQDIVDRCAALPGLKACALFRQDAVLISQGMDHATAEAFKSSASQTRESLRSLADSLGLGSGGNFTLRTDQGVRSFFLEPNLTLAIWHDQPAFHPGTREKLILITQELARD